MFDALLPFIVALACAATQPTEEAPALPLPAPSVWIDFHEVATREAVRDGLPDWVESVEWEFPKPEDAAPKAVARIRLRDARKWSSQLLARLFFKDDPNARPVVTAWNETGETLHRSPPLGDGLGLSTFENLLLPVGRADYLEIEVPGDGANLRGVYLTLLKKQEVLSGIDFEPPAPVQDPFAPARAVTPTGDQFRYGRVRATIDDGAPVKISAKAGGQALFQFDLESTPLLAVINCEILNVALDAPPTFAMNDIPLPAASLALPDLADPAYVGTVRPLEGEMAFRYTGWIKTQILVPGRALQRGSNQLLCTLGGRANSVAVRNVEVQLKYLAPKLRYELKP